MLVIVKSSKNRPLTKITIVDAFRLIKEGRARIVERSPITIKLIYKKTALTYLKSCTGYQSNDFIEWIVYHKLLLKYRLNTLLRRIAHKYKEWVNTSHTGWSGIRHEVLIRDKFTCQWCGFICSVKELKCKSDKLQVHHIRFKSEGGSNHTSNLITLCRRCHNKVHDGSLHLNVRPSPEWIEFMKKLIM